MSGRGHRGTYVRDQLAVLCWCMAEVVHVDPVEVRNLRTGSCGRHQCNEYAYANGALAS